MTPHAFRVDVILDVVADLAGQPLPEAVTAAIGYTLDRAATRCPASLIAGADRLTADPALTRHLGLTAAQTRALTALLLGTRRTHRPGRPVTPAREGLLRLLARGDPMEETEWRRLRGHACALLEIPPGPAARHTISRRNAS